MPMQTKIGSARDQPVPDTQPRAAAVHNPSQAGVPVPQKALTEQKS
jgi:hypothetical protein